MARETFTKNVGNVNCYSTLTWTKIGERWFNTNNTTGSNTITVNFSTIPSDAEIINATYSSTYYETIGGTGYQTFRKANGDYWKDASSANLKQWLVSGNRSIKVMYSYTPNTQDPVGINGNTPTSAYRQYRNVAMSVVYESGNKTWLLHYGSGDEWKQVAARGAEGGEWKLVEAYYGQNGTWTKLEKIDVGD